MHRERHDEPVMLGTNAQGRTASIDVRAAFAFAAKGVLVLGALALSMVGLERLILAYPERLGPTVSGFPWERIVELDRVRGEIVYFGDSVVQTAAIGDADTRLLPDMLSTDIEQPVLRVSQAATGADMHAAWLRFAERLVPPPRVVIIPVNLRSFSPHWERNPGWVFSDAAAMIDHPLFARLLSVLEWDWGRPTDEAYAATPVFIGGVRVGTLAEMDQLGVGWAPPPEVRTSRYALRFGFDIVRSRRMSAFTDLVREADAAPFPVIIYLTPIDIDAITENVDAATLENVRMNLERLRAPLRNTRWPSVDLSEAVRGGDFDHPPGDPHEHLRAAGRMVVAEALAEVVRQVEPVARGLDAGVPDAGADAGVPSDGTEDTGVVDGLMDAGVVAPQ